MRPFACPRRPPNGRSLPPTERYACDCCLGQLKLDGVPSTGRRGARDLLSALPLRVRHDVYEQLRPQLEELGMRPEEIEEAHGLGEAPDDPWAYFE